MLVRRFVTHGRQAARWFCAQSNGSVEERYAALLNGTLLTDETVPEHWTKPSSGVTTSHDFMVVHPKVRWGSSSASILKDPQRQLEEAVTLVNTLPGFRVVESAVMGVDYNTKRKGVWGTGQLEALVNMKAKSRVTALMVNVDMLSPIQQRELYNIFHVPVYDRYNIVLSIFKHYAKTPEAHLQIQLAEIPYIRNRLHYINKYHSDPGMLHIERQPERASVDEFEVLRLREQTLRKKLQAVIDKSTGKAVEETRDAAMVAVVGYTNSGKTSLVKCLTGAASLDPKDRLFATLDTTRHLARLPSGRKVVFTDTIGFLSDLPMHLLAAFQATLSHVVLADVIIHIRDISNPDWPAQSEDVDNTLKQIGLPSDRLNDVIVVDNKIDVNGAPSTSAPSAMRISCKTSEGVENLIAKVDENVLRATGCKLRRLSLKCSSPAIAYLYKEGLVSREPNPTGSHLVFDVFMNDAEFARFQKYTGALRRKS
uniref:Hflx-type G domain-containing protein n=1 Tax=Haemonchus contortus TaxID=6289 RepID=A0A7I4YVK6_HAECO